MLLLLAPLAHAVSPISVSSSVCTGGEGVAVSVEVAAGSRVQWAAEPAGVFEDEGAAQTRWTCPDVDAPTAADLWVTEYGADGSSEDAFVRMTVNPADEAGCATVGGSAWGAGIGLALAALAGRRSRA